jgi:hypothetical protein
MIDDLPDRRGKWGRRPDLTPTGEKKDIATGTIKCKPGDRAKTTDDGLAVLSVVWFEGAFAAGLT